MEAMLRLATLLEKPQRNSIRAGLAIRDLHYLLLAGPQAAALRHLYGKGGNSARLFRVIAFMKENLNRVVRASELAKVSNMSESSLFRHFKDVTGLSPLQYHKQLRLHQARNLMLSANEQVSTAAYSVGYESISQFNREYKKLFGETPGHCKIKI